MAIDNTDEWVQRTRTTSYQDIIQGIEDFGVVSIPTMFSPCKNFLYVHTLDLIAEVDDFTHTKNLFDSVKQSYILLIKKVTECPNFLDIKKLYLCQIDYRILYDLLSKKPNQQDIEYAPEEIFNQIREEA